MANGAGEPSRPPPRPRTIFHRSIEACRLSWRDKHLQLILDEDCGYHENLSETKNFDSQGLPLWHGKSNYLLKLTEQQK